MPPRVHGMMPTMERLKRLDFGHIFKTFLQQPASFWFVSLYAFFEYVRPQSIWRSIDVLPWPTLALGGALIFMLLEGKGTRRWSAADGYFLVFVATVLLSAWTAVYPEVAWGEMYVVWNWLLAYWLITRIVDNEPRFYLFMGLFLVCSLKMSQHASRSLVGRGFGFDAWGATGAPGFFQNSGEMAIQMTIFLPLGFYFFQALRDRLKTPLTRWKYWALAAVPVTALLALLASSSRGGQLAGAVVVFFMIWRSKNRVRGLLAAALVTGSAWLLLPPEQKARFEDMGNDRTSQSRLQYWTDGVEVTQQFPLTGIGYHNWFDYYRANYDGYEGVTMEIHNIYLQASTELGYVGLVAFLMMIGWTFAMNAKTRRRLRRVPDAQFLYLMAHGLDIALIGFMVAGFFVTVLYYPFFWINYALTTALFLNAKERARSMGPVGPPMHPALRGRRQSQPLGVPTAGG